MNKRESVHIDHCDVFEAVNNSWTTGRTDCINCLGQIAITDNRSGSVSFLPIWRQITNVTISPSNSICTRLLLANVTFLCTLVFRLFL